MTPIPQEFINPQNRGPSRQALLIKKNLKPGFSTRNFKVAQQRRYGHTCVELSTGSVSHLSIGCVPGNGLVINFSFPYYIYICLVFA